MYILEEQQQCSIRYQGTGCEAENQQLCGRLNTICFVFSLLENNSQRIAEYNRKLDQT